MLSIPWATIKQLYFFSDVHPFSNVSLYDKLNNRIKRTFIMNVLIFTRLNVLSQEMCVHEETFNGLFGEYFYFHIIHKSKTMEFFNPKHLLHFQQTGR